jgi:hypothetical protein
LAKLPIFLTTRDGRTTPQSAIAAAMASLRLERTPVPITSHGPGQACSYNKMLYEARNIFGENKLRALWIEDDILIEPDETTVNGIVELITKADQENWNIVAPYYVWDNRLVIDYHHMSGVPMAYSLEEVRALPKFAEVEMAGLGFYYGDIFCDYEFWEGLSNDLPNHRYTGVDWIYFTEKKIKLRHYPLSIRHMKTQILESVV